MIKSFLWYAHALISLLLISRKIPGLKKLKKTMSPEDYFAYTYGEARQFAKNQLAFSGLRVNVVGMENIPQNKAVLFVSNHQSNFDIGILLGYIDREKGFVAKSQMLKFPIVNTWMKEIHCTFMDRSDIKKSAKSIAEGIQLLKSGVCMVVFPEGTRSKSATVGEFKAGSFKLATKAQAPIVPITIDGSYKIMEGNGNKIKAADVQVIVHKPIETAGMADEDKKLLCERVRSIIVEGLQ